MDNSSLLVLVFVSDNVYGSLNSFFWLIENQFKRRYLDQLLYMYVFASLLIYCFKNWVLLFQILLGDFCVNFCCWKRFFGTDFRWRVLKIWKNLTSSSLFSSKLQLKVKWLTASEQTKKNIYRELCAIDNLVLV